MTKKREDLFYFYPCVMCGKWGDIDKHHIIPKFNQTKNPEWIKEYYGFENITIPLCFACHRKAHKLLKENSKEYKKLIKGIINKKTYLVIKNPLNLLINQMKNIKRFNKIKSKINHIKRILGLLDKKNIKISNINLNKFKILKNTFNKRGELNNKEFKDLRKLEKEIIPYPQLNPHIPHTDERRNLNNNDTTNTARN